MGTITIYAGRTCAAMHGPVSARMLCLTRHTDCGEYLATPVVYVSPTQHWSGFRPDRVDRIAAA